ncbi:hypothetical protein OQX61_11790 [Pedobacter sp. PLR]|uniref:outer membrane beta-barrel protein n=1 Tax=Pedobacter sp. PLR TaxID=2994465 RepID=UPI002245CFB8|nr:outer membrane beta-barrel protein [Pedobacter sp. PLR]MCX2451944.1 hypothetical protein [Pedobacter sp. PLR]
MKKTLLTILACAVLSLSITAQTITTIKKDTTAYQKKNEFRISVGLDEGIPTAYVSKFSSFVMGASLQGEYMVLKELGVTLSANYLYFLGKDGGDGLSMLPALAGVNYYITPKIFLSGQLGASWYIGKDSDHSTYFTYAQGIGFQPSKRISILAKYEGINVGPSKNYSFAGLRVAYKFYKRK